jgi:magnesium transporter
MPTEAERLTTLEDAIQRHDATTIAAILRQVAEDDEDPVELISRLSPAQTRQFAQVLGDDEFGDLIGEFDPADAARVLEQLTVADAADVLEAMNPDEAADVVGEILPLTADQILIAMEPVEAEELRELLAFPPDTAGGRMTPAYVSVSPDLRADQAVVALRRVAEEAETVNYVYVQDTDDRLLGVLSLHNLVLTPPDTLVRNLMIQDIISVPATADQEVAARMLTEFNLLALPVIDEDRRLLGIITADDVADILEQEATEDIERLGGSQPLETPYLRATPFLLWRRRIIWLLALFAAEAYTGTVLRHYEDEVAAVVALSFFIPLLIGTGGNVGSQVVTTIIRAMAVGDVRFRDIFRVMRKEIVTGVMLAVVMAAATFVRALSLRVSLDLGLVVAITVTLIVIWSAFVASMLPLVLRQLKVDPAVVSAPFISTLVDGTGLVIYFTVAKVILDIHT